MKVFVAQSAKSSTRATETYSIYDRHRRKNSSVIFATSVCHPAQRNNLSRCLPVCMRLIVRMLCAVCKSNDGQDHWACKIRIVYFRSSGPNLLFALAYCFCFLILVLC
jgi:hypothetical protein